jgi:hypothetical protein
MNGDPSTCWPTRTTGVAQTSMVAVFIASCGNGVTQASSGAGSDPHCGPLMYISGNSCQPLQIGSGADAALQGGRAADATMGAGSGLDAGEGAADSMTDVRGGLTRDASDDSTGGTAADVLLSDQCSNGIVSIASDILNPGDVYLDGTLQEGACYLDALTHWSDPNSACTGFDCYFDGRGAVIRPTDGRMLYMNTFENVLREFHADSCPMPAMSAYPSTPLANDSVIPTPMCSMDAGTSNAGVAGFVVSPEGDVYYHCSGSGATVWYDLAAKAVYDESNGYALQKIARGRMALVGSSSSEKLANLTTGVLTDVAAPPSSPPLTTGSILAIRARDPAGFWVAVSSGTSGDPDLWEIHPDGTSAKIGSYPPIPTGQSAASSAALDGCGALLQISRGPMTLEDTIVRRQVQGSSQVVYDEATTPLVKIHISYLITGP